ADSFTKTGVRLRFLLSCMGNVCYEAQRKWICPYISRHLLSLNPLQAHCRRYSRGER
ncbi:melibiose carrier protein, partial [Escherichia coli]|nr:melibiose carrier protein [Escherichia coli]